MNWSLHQLFPICLKPDCPQFTTRHMLPHQEEIALQILTGEENYLYWQGGVGSAKTMLIAGVVAALALMMPRSRGILFRKDYELNHETLWGYFLNAIEGAFEQGLITGSFKKCLAVKKAGKHTEVKLPNGSYYKAGETKNYSRQMGPSYDVIAISDAMENDSFGTIFHGEGTVGGLQSRLRGQVSSFYKLANGQYKDMRRFLIESNPPPNINELHQIFGKEPGVRFLPGTDITYRHVQTSNILNDHNPASYIAEISSQHSDPNDLRRILGGQTVAYYGGIKVNPHFHRELHVKRNIVVDTDLPLFVGIDPGKQHPAALFGQIKRCAYEREHFIALSEISNLYDKTTEEFASYDDNALLGILAHLGLFYPSHFDYKHYLQVRRYLQAQNNNQFTADDARVLAEHFHKIRFCIDKSSIRVQASSRDRESDRSILAKHYGILCKYRGNIGLNRSLDRVLESYKEICVCNNPIQLVDAKCEMLIDAYSGGYRYLKKKDGTHDDKPCNDHRYEDICDAHRYCLENFFFLTQLVQAENEKYKVEPESLWNWMEVNEYES